MPLNILKFLFIIMLIISTFSCEPILMLGIKRERRVLDREFILKEQKPPFPEGRAKSNFLLNTGGNIDQYVESGLVVEFVIGKKRYKRQIDSCEKVILGNTLIKDPKTEVSVAGCDDRVYRLILTRDRLSLVKGGIQIHAWDLPVEEAEKWVIEGWRDFKQFGNLTRK